MSLTGKRVVIIGGSSGIGRAVAKAALENGASVHIGSSTDEKLEAALALLGNGATGRRIDVRDEASVAAFFADGASIDHLIYTAGDWERRKTQVGVRFDLTESRASVDTRFWGTLLAIKYAIPLMSPDGSITLTSGLYAHRPVKGTSLITAFNGAVEHLARGLAVDLARSRERGDSGLY
jgi:NAD(P)-dependent dehydrogenase (short-subunit alcohol dehydrogenase family)